MKPFIFFVFAYCLLMGTSGIGQTNYTTGALIEDSLELANAPIIPDYYGKKNSVLPKVVSLRSYCPTPGNQRSSNACVGYAFGYGAMTIMGAVQKGYTNKACINAERFSPWFIFNQIKEGQPACKGASSLEAAKFLKNTGVCLLDVYQERSCQLPFQNFLDTVTTYKIKDWAVLFHKDDSGEQKKRLIKEALSNNLPVVAKIETFKSFTTYKYGPTTTYWSKPKQPSYERGGAHCIVIIGYDDARETFEIMNSWGTNWGDGGFAEIAYEEIDIFKLGFQLNPPDNFTTNISLNLDCALSIAELPEVEVTSKREQVLPKLSYKQKSKRYIKLEGQFELQQIEQASGHYFEEATYWNRAIQMYELEQPVIENSLFQVVGKNVPIGKYVYIFSCDAKGKVELHYPKAEKGKNYANFIPRKGIEIIYPSDSIALQLKYVGEEFWCILFSAAEIKNIKNKLNVIKNYSKGNFWNKIEEAFGTSIINPENITYRPNKMIANTTTTKHKGTIMPIILKLNIIYN